MWTMRILSALFAIASVLMTYRLTLYLVNDRRAAFLAGLIQLTTMQFVHLHSARTGELEPLITFLYTLCALLFLGGAYAGWRLKQGTKKYADIRDIHGFMVYLGVFISLGVAVMGFILLP